MDSETPSIINRLRQEIDELILQLDLGKAEAIDHVEKRKSELRDLAKEAQDKITHSETTAALHQKLDELKLQLALGRMESRDAVRDQREKIGSAIDGARHAFESVEHDIKSTFIDTSESLKTNLDAVALDLGLGKIIAEEELKFNKDQLKEKLHGLRQSVREKAEDADDVIAQASKDAREAFDEIRWNLRQLFK